MQIVKKKTYLVRSFDKWLCVLRGGIYINGDNFTAPDANVDYFKCLLVKISKD